MESIYGQNFIFLRDLLTPFFMYGNLFLLSSWKCKQRTAALLLIAVGAAHLFLLGVVLFHTPEQMYEFLRSMVQVATFLVLLVFMRDKGVKKLIPLISAPSVVTVCYVIFGISYHFNPFPSLNMVFYILGQMIGTAVCYFVLRKPLKEMVRFLDRGMWVICVCIGVPVIVFALIGASPDGVLSTVPRAIPAVGVTVLMVVNHIVIFSLYRTIRRQSEMEAERRAMEFQLTAIKSQIHQTEQSHKQVRVLAHDFRHYAGLIAAQIQAGDTQGALQVTQNMLEQVDAVRVMKVHYSDNITMNLLLNYYADRATARGVSLRIKVLPGGPLPFEEVELAVLLSNCIENAVTAAAKVADAGEKVVSLVLNFAQEQFFAEVDNPYVGEVEFDQNTGLPVTYRQGHGTGMISIGGVVRKHGGTLICTANNGYFSLKMTIPFAEGSKGE